MDCKTRVCAAHFKCEKCGYEFCGQLRVKQKYGGYYREPQNPFRCRKSKSRAAPKNADIADMRLTIKEKRCGLLTFKAWGEYPVPYALLLYAHRRREEEFVAIGFNRGDSDENVKENFVSSPQAANIPAENITGAQDHHTNVRRVTMKTHGIWAEGT